MTHLERVESIYKMYYCSFMTGPYFDADVLGRKIYSIILEIAITDEHYTSQYDTDYLYQSFIWAINEYQIQREVEHLVPIDHVNLICDAINHFYVKPHKQAPYIHLKHEPREELKQICKFFRGQADDIRLIGQANYMKMN